MKNELQRHKKGDKVKWVFTGIAFVLLFVFCAGVGMQLFAKDERLKPSSWFTKTECEHVYGEDGKCENCGAERPEEDKEASGGLVVTEDTQKKTPMRLSVASLNEDDGISAQAARSYTITATVSPSNTTVKDCIWTASFVNPSSSWASGKNWQDYITLSSTVSSATVTEKQPFGEQIKITATSKSTPSVSASCTLDYLKSCTLKLWGGDTFMFYDEKDGISNACVQYDFNYGLGTVAGTMSLQSATLKVQDYDWQGIQDYFMDDNPSYTMMRHNYLQYYPRNNIPTYGNDYNGTYPELGPGEIVRDDTDIYFPLYNTFYYNFHCEFSEKSISEDPWFSETPDDGINYYFLPMWQEGNTSTIKVEMTYAYMFNGNVISNSSDSCTFDFEFNFTQVFASNITLNQSNIVMGV